MTTEKKLIIVGVVALCGLIAFMIWYGGTSETINDDPIYGQLVGKKYTTKTKLYITQDRQSARYFIRVPGFLVPELKDIKVYPYGTAHKIIFKLVSDGATFTITKIILTKRPFRGSDIWIKARFEDGKIFENEIDVTFISDFSSYHEKMDPEYVREITSEKEAHHEK